MTTPPVTLQQELAIWRETHTPKDFALSQKKWAKGPVGKKKLSDWLKSVTSAVSNDLPTQLHSNRDRISALANQINSAGLSEAERQHLAVIAARANQTVVSFDASWPTYAQNVRQAVQQIRRANALRVLGQWIGGVLGVFLLLRGSAPLFWIGVIMIAGVIVAGTVLKTRFTNQAWDLNGVAIRPVQIANGILGAPPRGRLDASGLYSEVDRVWISGLTPAGRDAELQKRAAVQSDAQSNLQPQQSGTGDYAWLNDPRISSALDEIMSNIGGSHGNQLDRGVLMNALKNQLPSYATVDQALPVLRDIVERQVNKFGENGQTFGTITASERVLYNEEQ